MAVPRVIGIALKRPLRIEILHACEKVMNNEEGLDKKIFFLYRDVPIT